MLIFQGVKFPKGSNPFLKQPYIFIIFLVWNPTNQHLVFFQWHTANETSHLQKNTGFTHQTINICITRRLFWVTFGWLDWELQQVFLNGWKPSKIGDILLPICVHCHGLKLHPQLCASTQEINISHEETSLQILKWIPFTYHT